jgi:hypothetical protein
VNALKSPLLFLIALILGLVSGCGESNTAITTVSIKTNEPIIPSIPIRDDIYLRFTIDGDGYTAKSFNPVFVDDSQARSVNYWMAYKDREKTSFRMQGKADEWLLNLNFRIAAEALGTYPFEPDDLDMNQSFELNLRNPESEERKQYYAQKALLELTDYDGEYISGTFSGRFFRGSMKQAEYRSYVNIEDGEFRLNWAQEASNADKEKWPVPVTDEKFQGGVSG